MRHLGGFTRWLALAAAAVVVAASRSGDTHRLGHARLWRSCMPAQITLCVYAAGLHDLVETPAGTVDTVSAWVMDAPGLFGAANQDGEYLVTRDSGAAMSGPYRSIDTAKRAAECPDCGQAKAGV